MRKKSVFVNCMETLTANRKHNEARTLLNAGLKESAQRQTAATAPAYVPTKPYVFPAVDGNITYHTSWGSHGVKEEAETILSVLSSFRLRSTLAKINRHADCHCKTIGGLKLIINKHIPQEHGFCTGRKNY